jgi:hypothetical protein
MKKKLRDTVHRNGQTTTEPAPASASAECSDAQPAGNTDTDGHDAKSSELSQEELLKQYRHIPFPLGDSEGERQAAKKLHLNRAGANILREQTQWVVRDSSGVVADALIMSIMKSVQARDAVEEMLCVQMAWTHARLAKLSSLAIDQTSTKNVQVVHEACDRAANNYRRQMLALAEYRRPQRQDAFAVIKQANIANQQVVQNAENQVSENKNTSNEQGSPPPAQLPSYEVGTGIPTSLHRENQPVAFEHWPQDGYRQGPLEAQRAEAR